MNHNQDASRDTAAPQLNLKKFAPAPAGEADAPIAAGEGQTMFIRKTAARSVEHLADAIREDPSEFGLPVKDLLGLITYCYVRGVFSSKEIAEKLRREPELRKRFGGQMPDEADIKGFRRRYAAEIEDLLETVYRAFPSGQPEASAQPGASETEVVHRQAVERLHDAAWEDNMRRHLH